MKRLVPFKLPWENSQPEKTLALVKQPDVPQQRALLRRNFSPDVVETFQEVVMLDLIPGVAQTVSPIHPLTEWTGQRIANACENITGTPGSGDASAANQTTQIGLETTTRDNIGATNESAAGSDTATSGINGLFKRLLQKVTSLTALFPSSIGQKTAAGSLSVVVASDSTLGLTDTELRASPVPVSGPLTDTQLRAAAVPVSAASLPLPTGAALETGGNLAAIAAKDFATQTTLALIKAKTDNIDVALSTRTKPADTQLVSEADGANVTLGAKADAKSTATDTTPITIMSVLKQVSASIQAAATSLAGTLTVGSHNVTNAGTFAVQATEADGANVTLGAKADAKNSASDTTSITIMSVLKQISFSIQAAATSLAGTLTVAAHAVTNAGTFAVQATEADGANVTLGAKADAKSTASDTTSITIMSVLKQISFSIQAAAASLAGTLTVAAHAVTNAGTFAVQDSEKIADNAGFTDGTSKVQPAGFILDETAGAALTENDAAAARIDSKRAQVLVIEDGTTRGRRATVSAAGAVAVDGSAVTQPISAAALPLPTGAALEAGHLAAIDTSDAAIAAVAGTTAGAAVITDANGTLQQYLRGLVKLIIAKIGITIADGDDASIGAKADAFATTDTGTFSLIALFKRLLQGVTTIGTNTAASATNKGAANLITSQVTSTGSAATLAIARSTRRSVLFTNTHDTASVRIGPVTVTAGNGQILGPRESCPFTFIGLFQVIDDGATHCVICVADEYD